MYVSVRARVDFDLCNLWERFSPRYFIRWRPYIKLHLNKDVLNIYSYLIYMMSQFSDPAYLSWREWTLRYFVEQITHWESINSIYRECQLREGVITPSVQQYIWEMPSPFQRMTFIAVKRRIEVSYQMSFRLLFLKISLSLTSETSTSRTPTLHHPSNFFFIFSLFLQFVFFKDFLHWFFSWGF